MKPTNDQTYTIKEYLQYEIDQGQKFEFHDGFLHALAGGSLNHALLVGNIYAELRTALKSKPGNCKPITSEAKLHIQQGNKLVYPDAMVVCGEIETSSYTNEALVNPTLIVEVLSKSTAAYDRSDKFYFYRQIPTLLEYVLIEQDRALVEVYSKQSGTKLWSITRFEGLDAMLQLSSLDVEINLSDLYFDIDL